jgi:hypothetical protein
MLCASGFEFEKKLRLATWSRRTLNVPSTLSRARHRAAQSVLRLPPNATTEDCLTFWATSESAHCAKGPSPISDCIPQAGVETERIALFGMALHYWRQLCDKSAEKTGVPSM